MAKLLLVRHNYEDASIIGVSFFCPGCKCGHRIYTKEYNMGGNTCIWEFDGNMEIPTFQPSILFQGDGIHGHRCHSFVTSGMIQFLGDCTHSLVNQTIILPDFPGTKEIWSEEVNT